MEGVVKGVLAEMVKQPCHGRIRRESLLTLSRDTQRQRSDGGVEEVESSLLQKKARENVASARETPLPVVDIEFNVDIDVDVYIDVDVDVDADVIDIALLVIFMCVFVTDLCLVPSPTNNRAQTGIRLV